MTSYLVVPSYFHPKGNAYAKEQLMEEYQGVLSEIPCRLFNKGKGECPFRNSCFYAHLDENGNEFEYEWKDDMVATTEGAWVEDQDLSLAQRMGLVD
jgi:hypothetical protein